MKAFAGVIGLAVAIYKGADETAEVSLAP